MLTHVVLFKLKHPAEDAPRVRDALLALKREIPLIRDIQVGLDVLRSPRSYDLALIIRFDSLADHDAYQVHPAHQKVRELVMQVRESSVAVDYES